MILSKKELNSPNAMHYVIAFHLINLILILVLGTYVVRSYYEKMEKEFYTNNQLRLEGIADSHENEMQIMEDIATQINLSANSRLILDSQPEKASRLKEELYRYRSVNQFFDVFYYHYLKDQYLFNHSTSVSVDQFCQMYTFSKLDEDSLRHSITEPEKMLVVIPEQELQGKNAFFYDEKEKTVLYFMPILPKYDGVLIFFVGSTHFDRLLGQGEETGNFILYENRIIAGRKSAAISEEKLLEFLTENPEEGQREVRIDGTGYLLSVEVDEDGFSYVSVQKLSVFWRNLLDHFWSIVLLLILCCVPTVTASILLSKKMLSRIRSIGSLVFGHASQNPYRLDLMKDEIMELLDQSESLKENQAIWKKNHFVRKFLRGDYTAMEMLRRDARSAGFSLNSDLYMVGVLGVRHTENENRLHDQIMKYIQNEDRIEGYPIPLTNTGRYAMVLFSDSDDQLYQAYDQILAIGKSQCDDFVVAVSDPHRSLMNGSRSFLEANTSFDSRFLMDNTVVIRFNQVGQEDSFRIFKELRTVFIPGLESVVKVGNMEDVQNAIDQICRKLEEKHATLLTFRLMYDEILHILMNQWKGSEQDWNEIYNVFALSQCLSVGDFSTLLKEACRMLLESGSNAENKQSELAADAIGMMKERYFDANLNMTALSDSLGISPVTLAVEFKNAVGISPSDYLAAIRMDHAKELLIQTELLVRDIAVKVGYEDDHVFIRRFKKYTGMTPGQYRKEKQSLM